MVLLVLAGCSTGPAQPPAPRPVVTVTVTAGQSSASSSASITPTSHSPAKTATADPTSDDAAVTDVDPSRFVDPNRTDGYFFVSPSRNLSCGIVKDGGRLLTGCQAWVKVANLPACNDPQGASSPVIEFRKGARASGYCLNEGVFSAETDVLEYGQRITVGGVACTSLRTGVTCVDTATGRGFRAARAGFVSIG